MAWKNERWLTTFFLYIYAVWAFTEKIFRKDAKRNQINSQRVGSFNIYEMWWFLCSLWFSKSHVCWLLGKTEQEADDSAPLLPWISLGTEHWARLAFSLSQHGCSYGVVVFQKYTTILCLWLIWFWCIPVLITVQTIINTSLSSRIKDCTGPDGWGVFGQCWQSSWFLEWLSEHIMEMDSVSWFENQASLHFFEIPDLLALL